MNTLLGYSYQDGGDVSPAYQRSFGFSGGTSPTLAALLRKREKVRSQDEYEDIMREEAKKREQGSLWGGFGSLAGSLLLPALAGVSGGALLPLLAGLGGGLGKKFGTASGYQGSLANPFKAAKYEDYSDVMDDEDLIYGKDAFEDLESSARDYARSGMEQEALVGGLKHALMAGFGGDDSMYAKAGSTNLLKEGAGQRFKDLFKAQAMPPTTPINSIESANINAMNKEALRSLTSGTGGYNEGDMLDYITPTVQDTASIYETAGNINPFLEQPLFSARTGGASNLMGYTNEQLQYLKNNPMIEFDSPYTMSIINN